MWYFRGIPASINPDNAPCACGDSSALTCLFFKMKSVRNDARGLNVVLYYFCEALRERLSHKTNESLHQ
jgi:hypothetical protein